MNEQDDPEALVVPIYQLPGGNFQKGQLRDQFAMAALTGLILSNEKDCPRISAQPGWGKRSVAENISFAAYRLADAMLKERER